ncbi:hypothetical protein [Anaerorhabdus furcosa]|uniref:Uncharacterized protein n=1 Tax=Anaerorhabdus furcosa TaxID=118967 RepID=A0A1T4NN90_9FIRM|nr:hypothetical protein [Anaerorhabdus furcosa]SJZ80751.1 hypothetical protein SAMN02745191_1713 [Anaerorhabdus furcosa]
MTDDFYKVYLQDYLSEYHCSHFLNHPNIYNYIAYITFFLGAFALVIYELLFDTQSVWGIFGYVLAILLVVILSMLLWKQLQLRIIKNFKRNYPGVLQNIKFNRFNWYKIDETMIQLKQFLVQQAVDEWEANQRICNENYLFDYNLRAYVHKKLRFLSFSSTSIGLLVFSFIIKRLFEQILKVDIGIKFFINISNWFSTYILGLRSGNPEILQQTITVITIVPILVLMIYFYFKLPKYLKNLTTQFKYGDLFKITRIECEKSYMRNK